jgi:hypothetical protein
MMDFTPALRQPHPSFSQQPPQRQKPVDTRDSDSFGSHLHAGPAPAADYKLDIAGRVTDMNGHPVDRTPADRVPPVDRPIVSYLNLAGIGAGGEPLIGNASLDSIPPIDIAPPDAGRLPPDFLLDDRDIANVTGIADIMPFLVAPVSGQISDEDAPPDRVEGLASETFEVAGMMLDEAATE